MLGGLFPFVRICYGASTPLFFSTYDSVWDWWEEEFRKLARLPIAHGGLGLLSTTVLAPIVFLGSFALAAPALQPTFQHHGESLGPILRNFELGALPTQRALCTARNELDPKARKCCLLSMSWSPVPPPDSSLPFMSPLMPLDLTRFSREWALQGQRPGFGLRVARRRGIGSRQHLSFLLFNFPPLSL